MIAAEIPDDVRAEHGLPSGPLAIVSSWSMGDHLIGLWIGRAGERTGQRWPIPAVLPADAKRWAEEANE